MKKKIKPAYAACLFVLIACAGCQPEPVIHSIHPQIGIMGEPVVIRGAFFGKERGESYVTVAGAQPTSMAYKSWQDDEIIFITPEFGDAGLVYVHVKGKKSNGKLFTSQVTMPKQILDSDIGLGPRIAQLTPQSGLTGSMVTITGTGFGNSRGNSGVFFSWNAESPVSAPLESIGQEYTEVLDSEMGYELWTEREIRVRVPDGAISGNIEIRTARGNSPPMFFEVSNRQGVKTFRDKRNYTFTYSVNIKTVDANAPNTLYLWLPRPAAVAAQRNIELLSSSTDPFVENYRGTNLYKLDDLAANSDTRINLSWKVEVYGIETSVRPQSLRLDEKSLVSGMYTQSNDLLPSDDLRIKKQAEIIVAREKNPYVKAQRIYEWMLGSFLFHPELIEGDIFTALETKEIDSYTAALLYCTLLRCADVPCQPVAGVLVSRNRQTLNHYWAEFWIDGFGWIPVDPAMGAEAIPALFSSHPDRAHYYFGNIDSGRIAFSRGYSILSPMDQRGRTLTHSRSYALQSLWEEVAGGIDSYSSLWGGITVTGMYAQ